MNKYIARMDQKDNLLGEIVEKQLSTLKHKKKETNIVKYRPD